jgi:ATP-dependent DNA helicase RecQ
MNNNLTTNPPPSTTTTANTTAIPTEIVLHNHPELYEELRKYRRELAEKKSVPPYIIFTNKTLHYMCALLPRNKTQMLEVFGIGDHKFALYGEDFLKLIEKVVPEPKS